MSSSIAPSVPSPSVAAPPASQRMNIVIVGHVDHGKSTVIGRLRCPDGSTLKEPPSAGTVLDALFVSLGLPVPA